MGKLPSEVSSVWRNMILAAGLFVGLVPAGTLAQEWRQRVEVEPDQFGGVLGRVAALCDNDGDCLADMAYLVMHQPRLLRVVKLVIDPARPFARHGELGVGQQQMVEVARGLSGRCDVLILDEPTASLTSRAPSGPRSMRTEMSSRTVRRM